LYSFDELKSNYGSRIFVTQSSAEFTEARDKGEDSVSAGYYSFYQNKRIKSYRFFVNMVDYVYEEDYDEKGNLVQVSGSPFVFNVAELIGDSLGIKLYFFNLNKKYIKVTLSTNDNRKLIVIPQRDTLFSNMSSSVISFTNLQNEQSVRVFLYVEYLDICNRQEKKIHDTISLKYTPPRFR